MPPRWGWSGWEEEIGVSAVDPGLTIYRMAVLTRTEIESALIRLGALGLQNNTPIELIVVGGAAMVLVFQARESTHDVDALIIKPATAQVARQLASQVANEQGLHEDWLNDGAKGYLHGFNDGGIAFKAPGIVVHYPATEQLLAMKLSAWRDDVDIADARRLLYELIQIEPDHDHIWQRVELYLIPGDELKAQYAFEDLWEVLHG